MDACRVGRRHVPRQAVHLAARVLEGEAVAVRREAAPDHGHDGGDGRVEEVLLHEPVDLGSPAARRIVMRCAPRGPVMLRVLWAVAGPMMLHSHGE